MPYTPARRWRTESAEKPADGEADWHLQITSAIHSCRPKRMLQA